MKPHKHAELIKAWADGAEIEEYKQVVKEWCLDKNPTWAPWAEYRIKPKEKVVRWLWAWRNSVSNDWFQASRYMTEDEAKTYFNHSGFAYRVLANTREEFDE
jgi:hypothetical protein